MSTRVDAVSLDERGAAALARALYGVECVARRLPSERDAVFALEIAAGGRAALKIGRAELDGWLAAEFRIVEAAGAALDEYRFPRARRSIAGRTAETWIDPAGEPRPVRLLDWVPGPSLAEAGAVPAATLRELGLLLGRLDTALDGVNESAASRSHLWDPREAATVVDRFAASIRDGRRRALVRRLAADAAERMERVKVALPSGLIHGDANDHNVRLMSPEPGAPRIAGLIDFGDALVTWRVAEPAIAAAYAMLGRAAPLAAAAAVLEGYAAAYPLNDAERTAFYPLIVLRLCASVSLSAHRGAVEPENSYLTVSEAPAWALLERLARLDLDRAAAEILETAAGAAPEIGETAGGPAARSTAGAAAPGKSADAGARVPDAARIRALRARSIGPALRLSYREPLHIVRGWMQYLYDAGGRRYLDCVNNVAHVGHSHPRVVEAISKQAAALNTNTRYLYEQLVEYAARLVDTLPDPLRVCWFVNSGSEANELALRMARARTGARNVIVVDGAYHGNTNALIELSPYKFAGPGGRGRPDHVRVVPMPDPYRGVHRGDEAGPRYAAHVASAAADAAAAGGLAAFFVEPLLGCAGQIVPPPGWLAASFEHVRAHGGVCIADEVQIGLGRVGTRFWGFQLDGAVPDIVTMGKPLGNGHPLGAVVTTPEIAASFDNGMEYFNTFGGNPVSCAAGLAVLEAIEEQGLAAHARDVGAFLDAGLSELMREHDAIGDVRGRGLFLGIELVRDRDTREPAPELAADVVERMRERGVLLSTDGPMHNVIKIKPPLPFDTADASLLIETLDAVLRR